MLSNFTVTMIIRKKLPILGHLELNCVVNDQLVMNDKKKRKIKTVVSYLSQLYSWAYCIFQSFISNFYVFTGILFSFLSFIFNFVFKLFVFTRTVFATEMKNQAIVGLGVRAQFGNASFSSCTCWNHRACCLHS